MTSSPIVVEFEHPRAAFDANPELCVFWREAQVSRETFVTPEEARAAIALGVEREWPYVPTRMAECPACGGRVKTQGAVCMHRGAIPDAEKVAKHGLGIGAAAPAANIESSDTSSSPSCSSERERNPARKR
jgi:hypothetical protein